MGSFEEASRRARLHRARVWIKNRSPHQKTALVVGLCVCLLLVLKLIVEDHDALFLMAEAVHFLGIGVLGYKLGVTKNCSGLSLKSQDLTAVFLSVRLYCSAMMEGDWHTLLDAMTLAATLWICGAVRFTDLKSSYNKELDTMRSLYILGPCLLAALLAHPTTSHMFINRVLWALCVYVEAVSVLPQLRMMQRAKVVERFTANYVFALGVARFLSCAHWVLQIFDGQSYLATALGSGAWPVMVLLSEIVQTFILADFCYYYVLSAAEGAGVVRLPAGLV
jgi:ER lumen protein retaining receptor|tara:strand:+ start:1195 stop:2031 length:837 start_codon:yes stop_codon:yes gene_type:complete|mmetsp:Transcript_7095/g.23760  ORF Transcript_7095/g.23760 Transcript_7095/m.23760 type:complete len:279 (+) Transcript_7095:177-1013(+)